MFPTISVRLNEKQILSHDIMVYCASPNCSNASRNKRKADVKGWHYIPQNEALRKKWIVAMRRDPPYPKDENFALCGTHFEDGYFADDPKALYGGMKKSFKLKDDAVPTIFLTSKSTKKRKCSEDRASKRLRKEMISSLLPKPHCSKSACGDDSDVAMGSSLDILDDSGDDQPPDVDEEHESRLEEDAPFICEEDETDFQENVEKFDIMFVRWDKLQPLFKFCIKCGSSARIKRPHVVGATVIVNIECTLGHELV